MARPVVVTIDYDNIVHLPVGAVALETGDLLSYESSAVVLMDAVTEDATFCGVALGNCTTGQAGRLIPVATAGILEIDLTSAAYDFGDDLLWTSSNTLATAAANTLAWYWDKPATVARGRVRFDVLALAKLPVIAA
jgi:hypothetical protein